MAGTGALRKYLIKELGITQATTDDPIDVAIKTMRAMVQAYATVADALAVASGHPEDVGKMGQFNHKPEDAGFKLKDNR